MKQARGPAILTQLLSGWRNRRNQGPLDGGIHEAVVPQLNLAYGQLRHKKNPTSHSGEGLNTVYFFWFRDKKAPIDYLLQSHIYNEHIGTVAALNEDPLVTLDSLSIQKKSNMFQFHLDAM